MSAEDEWQKMVEEALNEPPQTQETKPKESLPSESDESGAYISSSEESDDDTISTSSCDSQEWAPTKPRLPIAVPMEMNDLTDMEPDDAEEAVRNAGLGMQQLSIDENKPISTNSTISASSTTSIVNGTTSTSAIAMMLPAFYEKLQRASRRFDSSSLYSMVSSVSLVPYPSSLNSKIEFNQITSQGLPASFANILEVPKEGTDSSAAEISSIPFISLLAIISSSLGLCFKQSWIIPFSVKDKSIITFSNPLHDEAIGRCFAYYKLAYLGAHSAHCNQEICLNGIPLLITNHLPALLSFKGSDALTSALASFYKDTNCCQYIELFGMSVRGPSAWPAAESEYHKGKNVLAHILKRLFELASGEYLLVHRSEEALCYVCSSTAGDIKDIDLRAEMPSPMSLNELNSE